MIASLPMYEFDRDALEAFWSTLAGALRLRGVKDVPDRLVWPEDLNAHWRQDDLFLSQTCGYPLVQGLNGAVKVLGAFHYTAEGCDGALYRSYVVARRNEQYRTLDYFRGRLAAYNSPESQSGYNAFRALVAPMARHGRFFAGTVETGSHLNSIDSVLSGRADVAAIDCVVLQAVERDDPDLFSRLTVVTATAPAP
ncbi:MAG: PhnD/SsuA/transferrin family substrate-binding protein, partial [Ancalomicrobiaceae bacterium]|nr:PhnD/SsuA/transferrin family substrate-binding protein [Ancalomicrobiaceae bacterium]